MHLPRYTVNLILLTLFLIAVGARFADTNIESTPYFKGTSAMNYRHALTVADGKSIRDLTRKGNWPEGYVPAAYRASGLEYFAGTSYRIARYFGETDGRRFMARLTVIVFSLCVFTMFALTQTLWACQLAGLIAAFLVTFFTPLLGATNGREFDHMSWAVVIAIAHIVMIQRARRSRSPRAIIAAGALSFAMMAVWEAGTYYVAAVAVFIALYPTKSGGIKNSDNNRDDDHGDTQNRRALAISNLIGFVVACVVMPHLLSIRALSSWMSVLTITSTAAVILHARIGRGWKLPALMIVGTIIVTLILTPVRNGAASSVPMVEFFFAKLLAMGSKPDAPLLPDYLRSMWSVSHAPPSFHEKLEFFFPLVFFAICVLTSMRTHLREHQGMFILWLVIMTLASISFIIDASLVVPASIAMIAVAGMAGRGLSNHVPLRAPLLVLAILITMSQLVLPFSKANVAYQVARARGVPHQNPSEFLWVSMENTDRELIRFIVRQIPVASPILGTSNLTAPMLTFSGRTAVSLDGAYSKREGDRNVAWMRLLYGEPDDLFNACRESNVRYVLYSIDMLLDITPYSPRDLAGVPNITQSSAVYRMHFHPATLNGLSLIYESDHYRLFKLVDAVEPAFITDHPPVYQEGILRSVGGDVDAFRKRIIELTLRYNDAVNDTRRGELSSALATLNWILGVAPRFTLARIEVGRTLAKLGDLDGARKVLLSVISYAPDNPHALYQTAYVMAQQEDFEQAKKILQILYVSTANYDILERGRLLESLIDQGIPVAPGQ